MFGGDLDTFEPFLTPLGYEDRFLIAIFMKILCQNEQIWYKRSDLLILKENLHKYGN